MSNFLRKNSFAFNGNQIIARFQRRIQHDLRFVARIVHCFVRSKRKRFRTVVVPIIIAARYIKVVFCFYGISKRIFCRKRQNVTPRFFGLKRNRARRRGFDFFAFYGRFDFFVSRINFVANAVHVGKFPTNSRKFPIYSVLRQIRARYFAFRICHQILEFDFVSFFGESAVARIFYAQIESRRMNNCACA